MTEIVDLWRYREVLYNLVRRNLKVRYKNSFLGFFWSLLNPLMQIGVWWFVFGVMFPNTEANYMSILITGFLPWLFFSQTILDSTACVSSEIAIVKKAYFPRSILPLSALISNLIHLAFAFVVLLALFALWKVDVNVNYWLVIPSTILVALFAYGVSCMVAAWSVFYADVKFIVGNLLGLWFFLTPVLYNIAGLLRRTTMSGEANWLRLFIQGALPVIKKVYLADPVAIGILGYRSALLEGGRNPLIARAGPDLPAESVSAATAQIQAAYPFWEYVVAAVAISVVTALVGHVIYRRLSRQFAERG